MNLAAATLIADRLTSGVMHPGDTDQPAKMLMPLPGFRNTGLPPEQAAAFANEAGLPDNDTAKIYAEALVNALETDGGLELVARAELEQLRAQVATPQEASPTAPGFLVYCHCNPQEPLLDIPLSNRAKVTMDGGLLKRKFSETCTCQ